MWLVFFKKNLVTCRGMFLSEPALLAYLLHPGFRGERLTATERPRAYDYVPEAGQIDGIEKPPSVVEVLTFVDKQPLYTGDSECPRIKNWFMYMADSPLAPWVK